jgi:hypothetical protein
MESKMRKIESRRIKLEHEQKLYAQALQVQEVDVLKAIIELCDRQASHEEDLREARQNVVAGEVSSVKVDRLERKVASLETQLMGSRKNLEKVAQSEKELKQKHAELRAETDRLREIADHAQCRAENAESESNRKVRYLEQENLQLMKEIKTLKKALQKSKAELNVLRIKGADDTIDLGRIFSTAQKSTPASLSAQASFTPGKHGFDNIPEPKSTKRFKSEELPASNENSIGAVSSRPPRAHAERGRALQSLSDNFRSASPTVGSSQKMRARLLGIGEGDSHESGRNLSARSPGLGAADLDGSGHKLRARDHRLGEADPHELSQKVQVRAMGLAEVFPCESSQDLRNRAPGLGETRSDNDMNTAECNQQ